MKVMDTPRTGKLGPVVFYPSPYGLCCRPRIVPRDPRSEAQSLMRSILACCSAEWSRKLTEDQRKHWVAAALTVPSHPSLGLYSHLSGHQLSIKINSILRCIGQSPVLEPPAPVAFSPNPVVGLDISNDPEAGVRLLLNVGTLSEDVMVYGQPPCSAGRMKQRRVYYLGLAGPATNGQCDITSLYTAKFGAPGPGKKVFIVTCQTKNGWQAPESVFSAIVPPQPGGARLSTGAATLNSSAAQDTPNASHDSVIAAPEAGRTPAPQQSKSATPPAAPETPMSSPASAAGVSSQLHAVYKRSTRGVRGEHSSLKRVPVLSTCCAPLVHALQVALFRLGMLRLTGIGA
jgi:hypothetical protein